MAFDLTDEKNYQVTVEAYCPSGFGDSYKTHELKRMKLASKIEDKINDLNKPNQIGTAILRVIRQTVLRGENDWKLDNYKLSADKNSIYFMFDNVHPSSSWFYNVHKIGVKVTCNK